MMRLTTSLPRWSVPRRQRHAPSGVHAGGSKRSIRRSRTGLWGATWGESTAATSSASRISQLSTASGATRLLIVDPRIEAGVKHIDQEVDDDEKRCGDEHRRLHNRVV